MSVRLGIIGAGAIGNMHAEMASKIGTEIVTVYDVRSERAERLAGLHAGTAVAASPEDLLDRRDVDAVRG